MFEDHVFTAFSAKTILFVTHIGPLPVPIKTLK
jgi:hypothetical protein